MRRLGKSIPVFKDGPNAGRVDRKALAAKLDVSVEQCYKLYNSWIQIFRLEGSTLSLSQYIRKIKEAGITPYDIGHGSESYQLSRYNDEGPYTVRSCRFITKTENLQEQVRHKTKKEVKCPYCKTRFVCPKYRIDSAKIRGRKPCCSNSCASSYYNSDSSSITDRVATKIKKLRKEGGTSYSISAELQIARSTVMKYL